MNKLNYLFADCVSHRNTLKINRRLNDFFDEEETKFFNAYYDSLPAYTDGDDSEEKPKISSRRHVRRQNVLCKFYYDGEIRQSVGCYGEGFCGEWESNYMIEYGLPNYNDLTLIDARFDVYDTELYG